MPLLPAVPTISLSTLTGQYIYAFKYDYHHQELSYLESRQLFGHVHTDNLLFSEKVIDPSSSAFIKSRLTIEQIAATYSELVKQIATRGIVKEGFKVEYLTLSGDTTTYPERLEKLREIGHIITGEPDYDKPTIIYALAYHAGNWFFGELQKHDADWQKHKQKPYSFSNSIGMNIGKTLVSLASKGNSTRRLLDACCGVGTVMLEACFSGVHITGCDINWKACKHTRDNLEHYDYKAEVYCTDIKDLQMSFDAAIIDLPYNLYTYSDEIITLNIISSSAKIAPRLVIVSITDITAIIEESGLYVADYCTVEKRGKTKFTRNIWVCERQ